MLAEISYSRSLHFVALGVAVLTAACAAPDAGDAAPRTGQAWTVTDDVGRTVALATPAERIISLLPATTETLVALGARDRLVARTDYDDPALADLPSVGGGLTPNLETVASLRPDLVVAWEEAGTARIRPRLEELGIEVFAVQTRDTADIYANVRRLGTLIGEEARAASLAARLRAGLDSVRASVEGLPSPGVLYLAGNDPPFVAGPNLFIGQMVEVAGGRNVFPELEDESPQMSVEEIVLRQPDLVLMASAADGDVAARLVAQPGWSELARSGTRFQALPADVLHRPGPSMVEAAKLLRDAIHPDWRAARAD